MIFANFLHFYQPPTQKKYWIDRITEESYRRLLAIFINNPKVRLTLNVNAVLCELWEQNGHIDIIESIKTLVSRGQIELTGSAKFHPLLPKMPEYEIKRQVLLNELGLYKYFGVVGPLMEKEGLVVKDMVATAKISGFFPPEMAYSAGIAKIISNFGYKWILAEELSYKKSFGKVLYNKLYRVEGTNLLIFFRNRYSSFKVLSGQLSTGSFFYDEFKNQVGEGDYLLTAMDGETFGHHRPGLEKVLDEIYSDSRVDGLKISDLVEKFNDVLDDSKIEECETFSSTWALMEKDIKDGVPFARWDDADNEIHKMQWELTDLAINAVNNSKSKEEGVEFAGTTNWQKARILLDRSLHSDQYWWASAKPWWSLEMIERGAKELMDVVLTVPDIDEELKVKAKDLYFRIITAGFEWQRTGKVDEVSKANDEEMIMTTKKELEKYSKDEVLKMIELQKKQMKELVANEEFERAIHPRNRIKELKELLDS